MSNISNLIEQYLKKLLAESRQKFVEVQRSDLAVRFNCVPSQINYVLTTRFSASHGYIVESRRGSGGYIRIVKIPLNQRSGLIQDICGLVGESIAQGDAEGLIKRLREEGLISRRESRLMRAVVDGNTIRRCLPACDKLRAMLLKSMLTAILLD